VRAHESKVDAPGDQTGRSRGCEAWLLPGGEHVTVRHVRPEDASEFQNFVRGLSTASRYRRFLTGVVELPHQILTSLTQVDNRTHLALVAETLVDGSEAIVGEARYVVAAGSSSGEFAVAVSDAWQRRGIGSLLTENLLRHARATGLSRLYGDVLRDNQQAIGFARRAGFSSRARAEEARLVRLEIEI
jgi:acetyltransferase